MTKRIPFEERFFAKIDERGADECWLWTSGTSPKGYGVFYSGGGHGKSLRAHRVMWTLKVGPIPHGMFVLHRCDNPPCCNPRHLFIGTIADNNADCLAKNRHTKGERHGIAKLTEDAVAKIRADTRPSRAIAADYGVNQTTISRVKRRTHWDHSPEDM